MPLLRSSILLFVRVYPGFHIGLCPHSTLGFEEVSCLKALAFSLNLDAFALNDMPPKRLDKNILDSLHIFSFFNVTIKTKYYFYETIALCGIRYVILDIQSPIRRPKVSEETAIRYLKEIKDKYAPGSVIADVPSNKTGSNKGIFKVNNGKVLKDRMILEVPEQEAKISPKVLDYAKNHRIKIRDIKGKFYN